MVLEFIRPLQLEVIYHDEFLHVELDKTCHLLYVKWYQHPSSPDFRRLFSMLVDMAVEQGVHYWLSDSLGVHYLEFSDQNWLLEQIAPLIRDSSITKYARITTKERMALMDLTRILSRIEEDAELAKSISLEEFFSVDEALNWLLAEVH